MVNNGDIWAFALEQRLFGQQIFNTFALRVVSVGVDVTEEAFMTAWWGTPGEAFNADERLLFNFQEIQSNEVSYVAWHVHRVEPNPTNTFVIPIAGGLTGSLAFTAETANLALSISRKGLAAGRRNRGRIAVAGVPADNMASGKFTAGILAEAAALAAQIRGTQIDVVGGTIHMGWYVPEVERVVNNVNIIQPAKYTDAVVATVKDTIRVQRSRTLGVGS